MTPERFIPANAPHHARTGPAKATPTKANLMLILDTSTRGVMTAPELILAAGRLYLDRPADSRQTATEQLSAVRKVMDVPATERLVEFMRDSGTIVGRPMHEWKELGFLVPGGQPGATYFMTAAKALGVMERGERIRDEKVWRQAANAAKDRLAQLHKEQYEELRQEAYDKIRETGVRADRPEEEGETHG